MANLLSWSDLILYPIYALLLFWFYKKAVLRYCTDPEEIILFYKAFWIKVGFTFLYAFVLQVVYGSSDSWRFYATIQDLREATRSNSNYFFEILNTAKLTKGTQLAGFIENGLIPEDNIGYMQMASNFIIPKIGYFLSYICFNSYLCIGLVFSFFALTGSICLYKAFLLYYPGMKKQIAIATLFLPSVLFWVCALSKESICFGSLGILFYLIIRMVKLNKFSLRAIFMITICAILILTVKNYILIALLPGLIILFFIEIVNKIQNKATKYFTFLFASTIIVSLIILMFNNLDVLVGADSERFKKDAMLEFTSQQMGRYEQQGGSAISIGESQYDGSLMSFVRLFPSGIFNSYYRPLLWEINNPAMMFSGLECFAFLLLTIYALYLSRGLGILKVLVTDLFALQCFIFAIFFGGFVGMTTFNLGTLVRYKTPALPFFLMFLFIVINRYKKPKQQTV